MSNISQIMYVHSFLCVKIPLATGIEPYSNGSQTMSDTHRDEQVTSLNSMIIFKSEKSSFLNFSKRVTYRQFLTADDVISRI